MLTVLDFHVRLASPDHYSLGQILQNRGEYEAALKQYQRSLVIDEEIGNPEGAAQHRGQIGVLFCAMGRYQEAFRLLLLALAAFAEMGLPQAAITAGNLKLLRSKWGEENFDAEWGEATEEDVPDWLK